MHKPQNLFEYERQASSLISPMASDYYASGACDGVSLAANRNAYDHYQLLPRVLVDVSRQDLSVGILGQQHATPLIIAPTAFHCLAHPQGEKATAQAAEQQDTTLILSTLATQSLEDVSAAADTRRWFQLYVHKDRALTQDLVARAVAAGYTALCLTVDAPLLGKREKDASNTFTLPSELCLANLQSARKNLPDQQGQSGLFDYFSDQLDASLNWHDIEWLASLSDLPIVLKGIVRADDAQRAVDYGAAGLVVSNHGGRQLDGTIATIDALADVVASVDNRIDVLLDGGVRRGTDVLKALALGAKAVLIGRPILWGLAVDGADGVSHVLTLLREELELAMALSGCACIDDITPDLLTTPRR
ncbi:4-hydroxymandelate oxidase [BD1-7 clade bacterium]|uniref:4-hydroxymandelate oxidase n=1 Tax=BD1-7 clade bacterium TaxID=2029982 RepID=A0A5S9PIW9_9GAMM|nr:4-hydroxymandelate oxidase [BD1-7 clade bacterium]CAA0104170.1 4-hydroxymandelate oxidase [BD1-7 clade bacterium]